MHSPLASLHKLVKVRLLPQRKLSLSHDRWDALLTVLEQGRPLVEGHVGRHDHLIVELLLAAEARHGHSLHR